MRWFPSNRKHDSLQLNQRKSVSGFRVVFYIIFLPSAQFILLKYVYFIIFSAMVGIFKSSMKLFSLLYMYGLTLFMIILIRFIFISNFCAGKICCNQSNVFIWSAYCLVDCNRLYFVSVAVYTVCTAWVSDSYTFSHGLSHYPLVILPVNHSLVSQSANQLVSFPITLSVCLWLSPNCISQHGF